MQIQSKLSSTNVHSKLQTTKLMKLPSHLSLCTSAHGPDSDNSSVRDSSATAASSSSSSNSFQSPISLPLLPSLQSLFLLDDAFLTDHHHTFSLPSPITALTLSGNLLYAAAAHQITVYDSSTLTTIDTFNSHGISSGVVKSIGFSDGKAVTAHQNGKIKVWKRNGIRKHKLLLTLPTVTDRLRQLPLRKNHVQVRRHKKRLWLEHYDAVSSLTVGRNGLLYSVSWDKTLKLWAPRLRFKCIESVTAHEDAVNAVTVSADGTVYTGSADGRIRVWFKSGSDKKHILVATLEEHKSAVNALALNTDGTILFSGACDRSILVWEREDNSGRYMGVSGALRGHGGAILCLINVSDMLISGSADRTVRIWRQGVKGRFWCLTVMVGHLEPVKSLAGKMEGNNVISVFSGGLDGEIKVWKVDFN